MKTKRIMMTVLLSLLALSFVFAEGQAEKKTDNGLTHIEMWYNATQTEVGPLPDDWVGYDILKNEFGIELEAYSLPSNTDDQEVKIRAAMAADELPDFFVASRAAFLDLVKAGMVADVTDCYALMPERTAIMFDQDAINFTTIDGRSYGFGTPSVIVKNEGLVIRKDWLDNLGLEIPTTIDELYDVMYAFTYNDPDGNGKNDTYGFGAFIETGSGHEIYPGRRFQPLLGAFASEGTWNMSADNFGLQVRQPEYYDFMVFLKKMMDTGVIDPTWMAYKKDDFRAAWKQGKFGIFREQNSALHSENNYAPFDKNFPEGELIVIDPPVGPNGDSSVGPAVRGLRIWCVSADAAAEGKLEKICEMFEWMGAGEGYILCGWGQEGVNFYYDEAGIPVSLDTDAQLGFGQAVGQTYIQLRSMAFNYASDLELVSRYPSYNAPTSGKPMSSLETLYDMQSRKWTMTNGQDSMPLPTTDLKTFYEQGIAEFLTGKRELTKDNWTKWVAELDKMGATAWEAEGKAYAEANSYLI